MFAKIWFFGVFASFVACAAAAPVAKIDVQRAAEAFVSSDQLGSALLPGRTVRDVSRRGELWIVALSPAGHVILSASDLSKPIVGFSEKDFVEPSPESPAFDFLDAASERIRRRESDETAERNSQWDALLNPAQTPSKQLLGASAVDDPATYVIVPPFLTSLFDQSQPYNDFSPLYDPSPDSSGYRGRCPCGCLATAVATAVHYFKWPARIDSTFSFNHTVTTSAGTNYFPIRFDGHNPIDWDAISDKYDWFRYVLVTNWTSATSYECWNEPRYDLRGLVTESTRFPISRLILWMDVLSKMSFGSGSSDANFYTASFALSDWYTTPQEITSNFDYVSQYLQRGIPCQVSVGKYNSARERTGGHQVVFHGWAQYGSKKLAYVNYGWGGENDGYYDIEDSFTDSKGDYFIESIWVGHVPRAKPQLDPLPAVCHSNNLTLSWHFPDFHTNSLSGFTITSKRPKSSTMTFLDDFSASAGVPSGDAFAVGHNSSLEYDGPLLYATSIGEACFTFPEAYHLTAASVLTYQLRSYYALGNSFEVQAKFNDGDWVTIHKPALSTDSDSGWNSQRVYLGGHGGETCRLRLYKVFQGGPCYPNVHCVLIDNFTISGIIASSVAQTFNVGGNARSATLSGLGNGTKYSFTVTPVFASTTSDILAEPETSDPITVVIEGMHSTPIPGQETFSTQSLTFSTNDTSGVWSHSGTARSSTSIRDVWSNSIAANLHGPITTSSRLSFSWMADCYYVTGSAYDVFSAVLKCDDGAEYTLWSIQNESSKTSAQNVSIPLGDYAGKKGKIVIYYEHKGSNYTNDTYGGTLSNAKITNVRVPSVPNVEWNTETLAALGTPEIVSVSPVAEGFYKGCGTTGGSPVATTQTTAATAGDAPAARRTTTLTVKCSEHVVDLQAYPSHLSLVKDDDIRIENLGGGEFKVCMTPSGINESNYRSRMILTLAATDTNGTTVYKDLSLRFAAVEEEIPDDSGTSGETVDITVPGDDPTGAGSSTQLSIPASWFASYWPTTTDRTTIAFEDSDADGVHNWQEYICGTNPTNADDKIECTISFDASGNVIVTSSLDGKTLPSGYKAVTKESNDLHVWSVLPATGPTKQFFKVIVEHE